MWPPVHGELLIASTHFENLRRVMTGTGIAGALQAEDYAALFGLDHRAVPPIDLEVLRAAGYADADLALRHLVRAARSAPRALRSDETLERVLEEGQEKLKEVSPPKTPKRWTGFAKLFTGGALASANIAGGIAAAAGGGPLAAGITLGSVLASCATGVGMIVEGVGSLRGK